MTLYGGSGAYEHTRLIGLFGMLSCSAAGSDDSDDMGGCNFSAVNTRCMELDVQDPQNPLFQVESKIFNTDFSVCLVFAGWTLPAWQYCLGEHHSAGHLCLGAELVRVPFPKGATRWALVIPNS